MSPARRLLLLAVGALVLVLALVVAVTVLRGDNSVRAVDQSRPGTVLLVPGYGGNTSSLDALAGVLRAHGRTAQVISYPGDGTADLRTYVPLIQAAADRARASGSPSVDVVGYSAGGIVVRLWLADGGADQARRVVTLGSPHHGTTVAGVGAAFGGAVCPAACQELVPGSPLLADLNKRDETPDGPQYLSLWTTRDQTVTPPQSARLDGAVDVALQDVCPGADVSHSDLPRDPRVQAIVLAALGPGLLVAPTSCPV